MATDAARCADPNSRAELIRLAERFIDLAKSVPSDFGIVAQALTSMMTDHDEPVAAFERLERRKRGSFGLSTAVVPLDNQRLKGVRARKSALPTKSKNVPA